MSYLRPEDYMTTLKSLLPSCILIYLILVNTKLEKGAGTAGTGILDGCKLP